MIKQLLFIFLVSLVTAGCAAQENTMYNPAVHFLQLLDQKQKAQAQYTFDTLERYVWGYIPKTDRKGISFNEMNPQQRTAALALIKTALSDTGYNKATQIMQLEKVLKAIENRPEEDHYRDTGKYFLTIFGEPGKDKVWGWRLDGHHLSLNFSVDSNRLIGGTPSFFGSNPAVVLSGPQKGLQILKKENELALDLLHLLSKEQLTKAIIDTTAPGDIVTTADRTAVIANSNGLHYSEMNKEQKELFIQLLSLYIRRYTRLFAATMMKKVEDAGMEKLLFAWAGSTEDVPGHPRYYRIQGPAIIIEYDNTQNNGNHVHTVIRDLKNDFGGDLLLQHYQKEHGSPVTLHKE